MPDVRLARPLLEDDMSDDKRFIGDVEPMIDAKQAAAALRLPYYWFADPQMRSKYRIPHYLMGGLVRYRRSELSAWAAHCAAAQGRATDHEDADVKESE
jgi:hypothetical protein